MLDNIIEGKQYALLGSRECEYLVGYFKDGVWYANADGEDYALTLKGSKPTSVTPIEDHKFPLHGSIKGSGDEEIYHLVELSDGRKQVAYWKTYKFVSGNPWYLDVFGEAQINPSRIIAPFEQ